MCTAIRPRHSVFVYAALCATLASHATGSSSAALPPQEPRGEAAQDIEVRFLNDVATRRKRLRSVNLKTRKVLRAALDWLLDHQDEDGSWDCDGFMKHDPKVKPSTGPGETLHDIGVTGLAALAILGGGDVRKGKPDTKAIDRALAWLVARQDQKTGLIGEQIGHAFLYNHGIGTLTLCEAIVVLEREDLREPAQQAVDFILRARNPHATWRYDVPPKGDNDTSMTAWMTNALSTAREAGLAVDAHVFTDVLTWLNEATDEDNGRIGYDSKGSMSSRVVGINDHFPPEKGEAMTAAGLFCSYLLGMDLSSRPIMTAHSERLLKRLPEWDAEGYGCDMYYWYYGTLAMWQTGGEDWEAWQAALEQAILSKSPRKGAMRGSWDPIGPWGHYGGRVYSTALMALALSAPVRYDRTTDR